MANASMKWTNHVSNILHNLQSTDGAVVGSLDEEDEENEEEAEGFKLP